MADVSHDVQTDPPPGPDEGRPDLESDEDEELGLGPIPFALLVLFEAALAPASLLLGYLFGQHPLLTFSWSYEAVVAGVLAALPMLVLLGVIVRWPVGPLRRVRDYFADELAPALHGCEWPDLGVLSVAAGVGEEMLFRGVIQGALGRWLGVAPAIVLASLLFGLLHPVSVAYVVVAAVLGAYLGTVWVVSGNLLTVIVAHALYDFVALRVLLHLNDQPEDQGASEA